MPIEFIGLIRTKPTSELNSASGGLGDDIIDPAYVREFAKAHEEGGFDKVLIGYSSSSPDGLTVASFAASATERLGFLIAHRPGFVAPTLAARKAATLDHFTNGRIAIHIITGGSDADQQKDGDWLDHDSRYRRTDEYLEIVRRVWTSDTPFDYEGEFYRIKDAFSAIKPLQKPYIPLYFGGASGPAVQVGAKHSNVYALWGEPIAAVKERIAEVRAALPLDRSIRFSVSLRPILGATEQQAWEKAHSILARIQELRGGAKLATPARPQAVGSQRLLDFAAKNEIYDKRLWTPIAAATGAAGNTTALVGTPEQVAEALVDYYDAGVTTLLIRGFDPLEDAIAYGRDVIPLVRAEVARRERQTVGVSS
ncbi:MAG: LLM class flavin-dependent oxidoreductase [Nostoc sp. DedQUE05]|uniref:LLM class flavin-dependent oxidoreductase n=1 Tax=Nostoc sp. DedQUE05 TaxID=3075391 RepID=UPI002AD4C97B|nr:LLM class flavin-dependent oxidoreductase [Nostoc sp. DedQUE05]MDZ8093656.1 LLM class flavin-dependent oxidoreductase [Nostoc sp. DedQUE05]